VIHAGESRFESGGDLASGLIRLRLSGPERASETKKEDQQKGYFKTPDWPVRARLQSCRERENALGYFPCGFSR
jgi:hypothetical protein